VIDLDNASKKSGEENYHAAAARFGGQTQTLAAKTGNGRHLFFRHPGTAVSNSVSKIATGVDVRVDGGYVVAAPSMHKSGRQYAWEKSC
jgi:putative DNA primase/helicase